MALLRLTALALVGTILAACGDDAVGDGPPDAANMGSGGADAGDSDFPSDPGNVSCGSVLEAAVLELANQDRALASAPALVCADDVAVVARAHSQDMCERGYFDHTNPSGENPFDRMRAAGIQFRTAGENIAFGQATAEEVHRDWMGSDGHRRNILNPAFGRIGIGEFSCNGRRYWTQVFAD